MLTRAIRGFEFHLPKKGGIIVSISAERVLFSIALFNVSGYFRGLQILGIVRAKFCQLQPLPSTPIKPNLLTARPQPFQAPVPAP